MRIAVSGRSLDGTLRAPETLHLQELIEVWHAAGDEVILVDVPGPAGAIGDHVRFIRTESQERWLRRVFTVGWGEARRAAEAGAEVIFIPSPVAPLVSQLPVVAMMDARRARPKSLSHRIDTAIGRAGLRGASGLLTFADLPPIEDAPVPMRRMPSFVGSEFELSPAGTDVDHLRRLGLAAGYGLAFGGRQEELRIVLAAWSWVAGAIGDDYPLVIVGGGEVSAELAHDLAGAAGVEESIRWIEAASIGSLPSIYRGADVFLNAGRTSTGQEFRWGLACGVPIASMETPETAAVVGEAGYLVAPLDTRALGAACLTLIIETDVAEKLRERGLSRARAYHEPSSRQAWADVFRLMIEHGRE